MKNVVEYRYPKTEIVNSCRTLPLQNRFSHEAENSNCPIFGAGRTIKIARIFLRSEAAVAMPLRRDLRFVYIGSGELIG